MRFFPFSIVDLSLLAKPTRAADPAAPFVLPLILANNSLDPLSRAEGWIAGAERRIEVDRFTDGFRLRVDGVGDFIVSSAGDYIAKNDDPQKELTQLDRETILGPVIVFALALRGVWALHSSAVMINDQVVAFVGESGRGKSTLAAYLSGCDGMRSVADDILPLQIEKDQLIALPHFPQLKISMDKQSWIGLPESLPLQKIVLLESVEPNAEPALRKLNSREAMQTLLAHTAGTRMFGADLLAKHFEFCAQAIKPLAVYALSYPHRREALPIVKELLEKI
jgi:hypothetical protein